MGRVTLQTVADHVGVSRMTVSNAFSRPDQLSADLRARILSAAEALGYVGPDPAARALARGSSGTVGVVLGRSTQVVFADEVAAAFLGAVAAELSTAGLSMTLLPTTEIHGRIPARDVPMDAALVFHGDPGSTAVERLDRRQIPMVLVDQGPRPGLASINVDDGGGAAAAARHLTELGHRRIGLVVVGPQPRAAGPDPIDPASLPYVSATRLSGWLAALAAVGVEPIGVVVTGSLVEQGHQALHDLRAAAPELTAVLCYSDTLAHGVMLAAVDLGLALPEQLSVVGFDDAPVAARLHPPLTTVRQDVGEKGRLAGAAVVTAAGGGEAPTQNIVLPTALVVRQSTAAPPDLH